MLGKGDVLTPFLSLKLKFPYTRSLLTHCRGYVYISNSFGKQNTSKFLVSPNPWEYILDDRLTSGHTQNICTVKPQTS